MTTAALLVSGAGDLGLRVALKLAQTSLSPASICCETLSNRRHPKILGAGFRAKTTHDPAVAAERLIVAFSPSEDYEAEVSRALASWTRQGPALLVSSIGVFPQNDASLVDESSPVDEGLALVRAERIALSNGAHVIRLAGLYDAQRGPHVYWESRKVQNSWSEGLVNLVHRADAAEACAQLLFSDQAPGIWCLSDGAPLSRAQISDAWSKFKTCEPTQFVGRQGPQGKRVSSQKIRDALGWTPRWKSFLDFVESGSPVDSP